MGKKKLKEPYLMEEITDVLKTLRLDAEMALLDEWDRSDDGFECQINMIDKLLTKLNK